MERNNRSASKEQLFSRFIKQYAVELPERFTLESSQDFLYISDIDTYELYFISMPDFVETFGEDPNHTGKKCYEILQRRSAPCEFCTNHLLEKDVDYIWKHRNEVTGRNYILKDRLVDWNGKTVRMEMVIDVTDSARVETVLQRSLLNQNLLTSCMNQMMKTPSLQGGCLHVLQRLGQFFDAQFGFIQCFGENALLARWGEDGWKNIGLQTLMPTAAEVDEWNEMISSGQQIIVKDIQELAQTDPEIARAFASVGIHSICVTPIFADHQLSGFIYLCNISRYWTEIALLTMLSGFLSMVLEKGALERDMESLQYFDKVAQCRNFQGFRIEAERIIGSQTDKKYSLWYCDIKNFKYINDVFGYEVGDQLLRQWSVFLQNRMGPDETFGRITGDNFVMLYPYESTADLHKMFESLVHMLSSFAPTAESKYRIDVAAGVYLMEYAQESLSLDEMINRANMAQKIVKEWPGSQITFYDETMRRRVLHNMKLEAGMQDALQNEEFQLYLQPQVAMGEKRVLRAETLVRWKMADGKLLLPGEFIALFEQDGLIVGLDRYVFEHACRFQRRWLDAGKPDLCLAINVSRISMLQPSFVSDYCRIKEKYAIPDGMVELEFTETIAVENFTQFREVVAQLQAHGFMCAMDDFGTSQSSLNLLRNLPLDVLKIDRLFFLSDGNAERGRAVIGCVLQLAQALKMNTVAEGIETMPLVEELRSMGCDLIQGYVFSKPMPAEDFFALSEEQLLLYMGVVSGQKK